MVNLILKSIVLNIEVYWWGQVKKILLSNKVLTFSAQEKPLCTEIKIFHFILK